MKLLRIVALTAALLGVASINAQTLRIGYGDGVSSIDPQFNNHAGDRSIALHFWDSIVNSRTGGKLEPGLAKSWKNTSPLTWEFILRDDIKWQDGKPMTANDIIFSLNRAGNVPGSLSSYKGAVRSIASMKAVTPHKLVITTKYPNPILPLEIASVYIVSEHIGKTAKTEDYNKGKAAIGTGPYTFVSYVHNEKAVFKRSPTYYGAKQPWETVEYRYIPSASARTNALLSGDVDVIDKVAVADVSSLQKRSDVKVFSYPGLRVFLLQPSFHKGSHPEILGHDGKPLAQNPLLNPKVRQALSLAINRDIIVNNILQKQASVANQWMPKGSFGFNPQLPNIAFNPEKAKQLLAEAGYPKGFQITISVPSERYPQASETVQAVAQFWSKIGVKTKINVEPWSIYSGKAAKNAYAMSILAWGNGTGEAAYGLLHTLGTYNTDLGRGMSNWGRYSNAEVDKLLDLASQEFNETKRSQYLQKAAQIVSTDVGHIPLFHYNNVWAARKGYHVVPLLSDRTTALQVTAK